MARFFSAVVAVVSASVLFPLAAPAQSEREHPPSARETPHREHHHERDHERHRASDDTPTFVPGFGPAVGMPQPAEAVPTASAVDPFLGRYIFASNVTVAISSPISTTQNRQYRQVGEVTALGHNTDRLLVTNDNGERCVLTGTRSGANHIRFTPGQVCHVTDAQQNMRMALTLRSGDGTITGNVLAMGFEWNVEASAFLPVSGLAAQRTTGSRLPATPSDASSAAAAEPSPGASAPSAMAAPAPDGNPYPQPAGAAPSPYGASPTTASSNGIPWVTFGQPVGSPSPMPATALPYTYPTMYPYPSPLPYGARTPVYSPATTVYPPGYPYGGATVPVPSTPRTTPYGYAPPDPNTATPLYLPAFGSTAP